MPPGIIEALRADFIDVHPQLISPAHREMLNATRQYHNPWGLPRTAKAKWANNMALKHALREPAPVLLFIGCTMASSQALSARARKAAEILKTAGVDFAILGNDEPCCRSVQKRIGDVELAHAMMEENISLMNRSGSSSIVTLCAGCANMLRNDYREAGKPLQPKVMHVIELLPALIKAGKLSLHPRTSLKVTYHDPCHLGRQHSNRGY